MLDNVAEYAVERFAERGLADPLFVAVAADVSGPTIRSYPRARHGYAATGVVAMPPSADSLCSLRVLSILTDSVEKVPGGEVAQIS